MTNRRSRAVDLDVGAVIGRFQPVHNDHLALIQLVAERHEHVVVAITNADPSWRVALPQGGHRHEAAANPFTYWERAALIRVACDDASLGPDRVTIGPFPIHNRDLWHHYLAPTTRCYVRVFSEWEREKARRLETQFPVTTLTPDRKDVSGTIVRDRLSDGNGWQSLVPPATIDLLRAFLATRSLSHRGAEPVDEPMHTS